MQDRLLGRPSKEALTGALRFIPGTQTASADLAEKELGEQMPSTHCPSVLCFLPWVPHGPVPTGSCRSTKSIDTDYANECPRAERAGGRCAPGRVPRKG